MRTRVHEYGGGAWWPHDGSLYYVEFADQRLRRLDARGDEPVLLTAEPPEPRAWRYADGRVTPDGRWCVCVRERHDTGGEPANELVAIAADGSQQVEMLWAGGDFVMTPRVSPDGSMLAWISWDHPNMGWDATRLHLHRLGDGELGEELMVLGRQGDRSLCEPGLGSRDGRLGAKADGVQRPRRLVGPLRGSIWARGTSRRWLSASSTWPPRRGCSACSAGPRPAAWSQPLLDGPAVTSWWSWTRPAPGLRSRGLGEPMGSVGYRRHVIVADSSLSSLTIARGIPGGAPLLAYAGAGWAHEAEVSAVRVDRDGHPHWRTIRPARELDVHTPLVVPAAITFPTGPRVKPSPTRSTTRRPTRPAPVLRARFPRCW